MMQEMLAAGSGGGGTRTYGEKLAFYLAYNVDTNTQVKAADIVQMSGAPALNSSQRFNVYFENGALIPNAGYTNYIDVTVGADGYVYLKPTYTGGNYDLYYI